MFKIIGADQKEYGPVSSDQIRQWIAQGRINAHTRVQAEGGLWRPLGDFPEFASSLGPSVPPIGTPTPQVPPSAQPVKTSGMAIASLVLGLLGLVSCGTSALIGLILGIIAMGRVRKSHGTLGGGGLALAGTIVSAFFLVFTVPIGAALLLPALAKAKQRAMAIQCINNMRQLSLAAQMYAADHNDHFPDARAWSDDLKPLIGSENIYRCPAAPTSDRCDYGYNARVAGLETKNVNPQTVLFFETDDGWNQSGGPELMQKESRHRYTFSVAFADGHVEQVRYERLAQLRWEP